MPAIARRAEGAPPVAHSERVLGLSHGLCISCEEARDQGVLVGGEGVHCDVPVQTKGHGRDLVTQEFSGDRASHLLGHGAGGSVHTFVNEDPAGGVKVQGRAAEGPLAPAQPHGALLQKCGVEASFAERGQGPDGVIAKNDGGPAKIQEPLGCLEG